MNWKLKAKIQRTVSFFPSDVSYAAYYWMQRRFGGLRRPDPVSRLNAGIETWKWIQSSGIDPQGKTFFEVGTGRVPLVPIAFWLMGCGRTTTIDANPYLKSELIAENIRFIAENPQLIRQLFGSRLREERFERLLELAEQSKISEEDVLGLCNITYVAPGDASATGLPPESVDFHTSYAVFEHISPQVLKLILVEGNRITSKSGLFVHRVDYSDHFSHSDNSISAINFLQYSDGEWDRYAGNRYMYMNRLRHDDFLGLFEGALHRIVAVEPEVDPKCESLLSQQLLPLDKQFEEKSKETLATVGAWIVSAPLANF